MISVIPSAVAQAAMKSGVARKKIPDLELYKDQLTNRLDPTMSLMQGINAKVRKNPKRVIFAEGEDENMLKAAIEFGRNKLGTPILIGAEKRIKEQLKNIGLDENYKIEIVNSTDKEKREKYVKHLYKRLQREGQLERDVDRLVRNERIAWGASMIACKDADAMVTGNIRHYAASIEKLKKVNKLLPRMQFPCMDALSYSHFCEGKIDTVFQSGNKIWDIYPLIPIIKASGGTVTNWENKENFKSGNVLISSTKQVHKQMLKMLKPLN